jgi:hypothetical protein
VARAHDKATAALSSLAGIGVAEVAFVRAASLLVASSNALLAAPLIPSTTGASAPHGIECLIVPTVVTGEREIDVGQRVSASLHRASRNADELGVLEYLVESSVDLSQERGLLWCLLVRSHVLCEPRAQRDRVRAMWRSRHGDEHHAPVGMRLVGPRRGVK